MRPLLDVVADIANNIGNLETLAPPAMAYAVSSFTVAGSVSNYGADEICAVEQAFATGAGVSIDAVTIELSAGSVVVSVTISAPATDVASITSTLNAGMLATPAALQSAVAVADPTVALTIEAITAAEVTAAAGEGASGEGPEPVDAAERAAAAVAVAANELSQVLSTVEALDPAIAESAASAISALIDVHSSSQGSASSGGAANNLAAAVTQLARAATPAVNSVGNASTNVTLQSSNVTLTSANLNMTIEIRPPWEIAAQPVECDSTTPDLPVTAHLPATVLSGIDGVDPSLPVVAVLYTVATNLHSAPTEDAGSPQRRLSETNPSDERLSNFTTSTSPTVSFSLRQPGSADLAIRNVHPLINISLPFRVSSFNADRPPCVGAPADAETAAQCDTTVECRFWNDTLGNWSTDGCTTVLEADGSVGCSCSHLTEFIAFEFPTSADDLLALFLSATRVNTLTSRAFECALNPSRSWVSVPAIWGCMIFLLLLFFGLLANAIRSDRREIRRTLAVVSAKRAAAAKASASEARSGSCLIRMPTVKFGSRSRLNASGVAAPASAAPSPPASPLPQPTDADTDKPLAVAGNLRPPADEAEAHEVLRNVRTRFETEKNLLAASKKAAADRVSGRWKGAKYVAKQEVMAKRWHKDVDRVWKRLVLACFQNHTLCAGICYHRGTPGYTRAQTVMILLNSFAFELIMLCLLYAPPAPAEEGAPTVSINPVGIAISGTVAALIVIPTMLLFAWLFDPIIIVRAARWLVTATICWPCWVRAFMLKKEEKAAAPAAEPEPEPEPEPEATPGQGLAALTKSTAAVAKLKMAAKLKKQLAAKAPIVEEEEPPVLPPGWKMHKDDSGRRYFYHTEKRISQWHAPPMSGMLTASGLATAARRTRMDMNGAVFDKVEAFKAEPGMTAVASLLAGRGKQQPATPPPSPPAQDIHAKACKAFSLGGSQARVHPIDICPPAAGAKPLASKQKAPAQKASAQVAQEAPQARTFSYESVNDVLFKASLTYSWEQRDLPAVRKILFGWCSNVFLFFLMLFFFFLYGCELFEPPQDRDTEAGLAGNTDELIIAWIFSAFQRFVLHEPTLILAAKGLPILFASSFCANCCGESIVNLLSTFFVVVVECFKQIKG